MRGFDIINHLTPNLIPGELKQGGNYLDWDMPDPTPADADRVRFELDVMAEPDPESWTHRLCGYNYWDNLIEYVYADANEDWPAGWYRITFTPGNRETPPEWDSEPVSQAEVIAAVARMNATPEDIHEALKFILVLDILI